MDIGHKQDLTFGICMLNKASKTSRYKPRYWYVEMVSMVTSVLILLVSVPPGITPQPVFTFLQQLSGTNVWFPLVKGVLCQSL